MTLPSLPADAERRRFLVSSAIAGGGLALGVPLADNALAQAPGATGAELNVWVVVKPDDTCVIRIARTEMGQGTLTTSPGISSRR